MARAGAFLVRCSRLPCSGVRRLTNHPCGGHADEFGDRCGLPLLHDPGAVAARDTAARSTLLPPHLYSVSLLFKQRRKEYL
jgi:hypothetical protein